MRKAWDTFSLHTGIAGLMLPILTGLFGYIVGARAETIGTWRGVLGGVAVAVAYYSLILLFVTLRQLWNDYQSKLAPRLHIDYDAENSYFTTEHETYRLHVWNSGVSTIDDVKVRLVAAPTESHLKGILPITLRAQHDEHAPFTLNDNVTLYIDLLEYSNLLTAMRVIRNPNAKVALISDPRSRYGGIEHTGTHEFAIEVSGRNAPTALRRFRITSLLPTRRPNGASFDIAPIVEFTPNLVAQYSGGDLAPKATPVENRPRVTLELVGGDQAGGNLVVMVHNDGTAVAINVTAEWASEDGTHAFRFGPVPRVAPGTPAQAAMEVAVDGNLRRSPILSEFREVARAALFDQIYAQALIDTPPEDETAEANIRSVTHATVWGRHEKVFEFVVSYSDLDGRLRYGAPHVLMQTRGALRFERKEGPEPDPIPLTADRDPAS